MAAVEKIAIIGLDCAEPSLVFEKWWDILPNMRRLCETGRYGNLESSMPPITVPAWSCMMSSKDPGTLGIYGFRNRKDHTYDGLTIATSLAVKERRLWDYLDLKGQSSIVIGVPGTFPITKPVRGCMICGFLAPDAQSDYTYPKELKAEIRDLVGEYLVDVKGFRTDDKQWLLDQIYDMTEKRFAVAKRLVTTKPWSLFMMVEMGVDRIHHGFWQFMDPEHHRYEPGNPFENAIRDYYIRVDKLIGELLDTMDLEKTAVWVVSDHGGKCMIGGFCFNDWLIEQGYLVMKEQPTSPTKFSFKNVNWSKTRVWGEGGYYGRCFINVAGREPEGIVPQDQYEALRDELIGKLNTLPDHEGKVMGTKAYKPQDIYAKVNGVAPDLVVIFGDLSWRSVGTIGNDNLYVFENDTGPDDANHAQQGMYILSHPSIPPAGRQDEATLYDVCPTSLQLLGHPLPPDLRGKPLV